MTETNKKNKKEETGTAHGGPGTRRRPRPARAGWPAPSGVVALGLALATLVWAGPGAAAQPNAPAAEGTDAPAVHDDTAAPAPAAHPAPGEHGP